MSGHGHHDAGADHAAHVDHHEDPTTSDDFPADEPRSPGWLPLLGGALFLAGIFTFVVLNADDSSSEPEGTGEAKPPAAALARPAGATPAVRPGASAQPGAALPAGHEQFVRPAH